MTMPHKLISSLSFVFALLLSPISLANDNLPAADRLKSCDPRISLAAAKEILNGPNALKEPLEMFSPAFVLFQNGEKDEGVFWFYAAQLRVRYQLAFEKGDRGQLLSIMLMTMGPPINNYAFHDVRRLDRTIERVLEWDRTTPNPFRDRPRSSDIEANLEKVYSGIRDLKLKLVAEKDDLEQKARAAAPQIEQSSAQSKTRPCKPGEPDPALARQTIETEKKLATEFAKLHPDVVREVGTIQSANVMSYKQDSKSALPIRYTVLVGGSSKRVYAEIDVSRAGAESNFVLACVTPLSIGQRDPFKDVCAK